MKRGDVWWVNFDPALGGEIQKKRPAIIVSNNASNKYLNRVQVVPVSSNISKLYPSETYVTVRSQQHKALADQLTTASKLRLMSKLDSLSQNDLDNVEKVIRIQLDMN